MADVTIHVGRVNRAVMRPGLQTHLPYACVTLHEGRSETRLFVDAETAKNGREIAAAIIAACDLVENIQRLGVVPIASLAPDVPEPVNPDDLAPTTLDEYGDYEPDELDPEIEALINYGEGPRPAA